MSESDTVTVEIDFAVERGETVDQAVTNMVRGHDVSLELVTEASAANGHPVAKVIGARHAVKTFLEANGYEVADYIAA